MHEFSSLFSYHRFVQSIKGNSERGFDAQVSDFLLAVLDTCNHRRLELPIDEVLWRAQCGHDWKTIQQDGNDVKVRVPFSPGRMKPIPALSQGGRVNLQGISYLYLATHKETAMAEVRPSNGSYVSVGQFQTLQALTLVDCSKWEEIKLDLPISSPDQLVKPVWGDIDVAFTKPIDRSEPITEYAPTQLLAEVFRSNGYDGIAYKSALGIGLNIALFHLNTAKLVTCDLYEVKKDSYELIDSI